jgi:hypothetical protein
MNYGQDASMPAFTRAMTCRFHSIAAICACLSVPISQKRAKPRHSPTTVSERRKLGQQIKTHQRHELHVGRPCARLHYYPRHPRPLCPATRAQPRSCLSQCLARHVRCRGLSWGRNTLLCPASTNYREEKEEEEKKSLTRERRTDFSPADISKVQQHALLQRVKNIFTGYRIW